MAWLALPNQDNEAETERETERERLTGLDISERVNACINEVAAFLEGLLHSTKQKQGK